MTTILCTIAIAVIIMISFGPHCAAQSPPAEAEIRSMLRRRVDAEKQSPGIVVGLLDAKGATIVACGKASLDGGAEVDGDTVFEIGSITKVFTGLLLADMAQRGEVKLNDPISQFLPPSAKAPSRNGRQITLLDLALHRSGLPRMPDNFVPRDGLNPYADYTVEQMYAFLSDYTLPRDVGGKYEYSNFAAGLLGNLLARRAGTNYETLVQERVFQPLGMKDTAITLSPRLKARLAQPYNGALKPVKPWDFDALAGAGSIRSTVRDMLKFLSANMNLTPSGLWPAMQSMQEPMSFTDIADRRMGLAWLISEKNARRIVWHNGQTGGFHSFMGFDPTNRIGLIVLANAAHSIDDIGFHLIDPKRPLANPKTPEAAGFGLAPPQLDRFVGRYQLSPRTFFNLRRDEGRLMAQLTGQSYYEIFPKSETNFFYKVVDAQITFNCDSGGKVKSLTLHQHGTDQTAEKISNEPPRERQAIKPNAKLFDSYAGEYELAPGAVFTIRHEGGRLLVRLTGQPFLEIFPESETEFFCKGVDAQISFVRDADGKATALVLHQNGIDQRALRK